MTTAPEALNLTQHRAPQSVWDKRGWHDAPIEDWMAPWWISVAGASLVAYGASRRSWRGAWYIVSGATLIGCVAAGWGHPRDSGMRWRHRSHRSTDADPVTTESIDSFPASDAPSSNGGMAAGAGPIAAR